MPFYFAWVGGAARDALSLKTKGDVWGGSLPLYGSVWGGTLSTTADILPGKYWDQGSRKVDNLLDVRGLRSGQAYDISTGQLVDTTGRISLSNDGSSVKASENGTAILTFDGVGGGSLNVSLNPKEATSVTITSDTGRDQVVLEDTSGLVSGLTYTLEGTGIPAGTTFDFAGSATITISQEATENGDPVELTASRAEGRNVITNLTDTTGLVVDETYQVFGRGLSATCLGTFQADGTLLLSEDATISTKQTDLRIHRGTYYPDGGPFDDSYVRQDEKVLSVEINHQEGSFALLTIELKNPRVGLLSTGRQVWCWLSWKRDDTSPAVSLIHARLMAIPAGSIGEKVKLQFVARPGDYEYQQALLMATMREPPYWDAVWYKDGTDDPTTILETRTEDWHIDRRTLVASTSDIVHGEDGTLLVGEDQAAGSRHLYESLEIKFGNPPLSAVYVTAQVSWTQRDTGIVDISEKIKTAFKNGGSKYGVASYQGDGLFSSWPKPNTSIGGGWKVGEDSTIEDVTLAWLPKNLESTFSTVYRETKGWLTTTGTPYYTKADWSSSNTGSVSTDANWADWSAVWELNVYDVYFPVAYEAARNWTETVSFLLEADIQQIQTDSQAQVEEFSLTSNLLQSAVDLDGTNPLKDDRYNSYFKTSRGQDSFRWLLAYAKAKLVWRARAVEITFKVPWEWGLDLSCRKNVTITDGRLPGGSATGKVKQYILRASADGGMSCEVTLGCTIGLGGSLNAEPGVGVYASTGYMSSGYQSSHGGTVDLGDNTITYQNFNDFIVDDDGVDFFKLDAESAVKRLTVVGTVNQQRDAIAMVKSANNVSTGGVTTKAKSPPDPVSALQECYTRVLLEMNPVEGGDFLSQFSVDVSKLQVPKTIDLEAA